MLSIMLDFPSAFTKCLTFTEYCNQKSDCVTLHLNAAKNGTVLTVYSWNGVEVGDTGCSSREKKLLLSTIVSIFKVWHVFPGGRRTKNKRCRRVLNVLLIPSAGGQQRPGLDVHTHLLFPLSSPPVTGPSCPCPRSFASCFCWLVSGSQQSTMMEIEAAL